ncbi:isoflavone 7-O-methyltransferase [Arachis duranensis]|uniref:Isoflavone 7-O-methyltransferase n=1 Tax=Arachis duranensis TaxID=130453 RepID=A0A6P4BIZ3_ARADU|nr:isoflavone 7-O-methyltransferase [Arachis duranensis]
MASNNNGRTASESFKAQALVYRHMYGILDAMCLKWIVNFRIPNIIHNHGKPITLSELVSVLKIPSAKVDTTDLFMRYMAHNGFFDIVTIHGDDDSSQEENEAFALTAASELLIKGTENPCISPMVEMFLNDPTLSSSMHHLNKWFYDENRPLYEITLGKPLWEFLDKNPTNLSLYNDAMASDSQMIKLALEDHNMVFEGLETIVDVGGGTGTTAQIISEKFPTLKCIVFDLPHVVKNLKGCNNLSFVGGDMFESIPKADAILLKVVLHNWSEDNCVKILRNCKDAINASSKNKNKGKIIILDSVIDEEQDEPEITRLKLLMNISMHIIHDGKEKTKKEWKNIFYKAGLYNYKISPFTGYLSLIEIYP